MKKKIVSFVLAVLVVAMAASMASCEKLTASALVLNAIEKTSALNSVEAESEINVRLSVLGVDVSIPITYSIKGSGLKTDSPVVSADMAISMLGYDMELNTFTEGDWSYISMLGQNFKVSAKANDDYDAIGKMNDTVKPLPSELFENIEVQNNDDGTKTVTVTVPDDTFAKIYDAMLENISKTANDSATIDDLSVSDGVVAVTVNKNGYIDTYNVSCNVTMTLEAAGASSGAVAEITASVKYKNPGADVTPTPPEGYKDYPEIDLSLLA